MRTVISWTAVLIVIAVVVSGAWWLYNQFGPPYGSGTDIISMRNDTAIGVAGTIGTALLTALAVWAGKTRARSATAGNWQAEARVPMDDPCPDPSSNPSIRYYK